MRREYWENTMKILIENPVISKNELFRQSDYGNKNRFFQFLDEWEKEGLVAIKQVGREKQVSLSSPDKKINKFINDFGKDLVNYEKLLKKHLIALEKNKPLISPKKPFKPRKGKRPAIEVKKKDNVLTINIKTEDDPNLRAWNTRTKPLVHFETILNLLNKLYQQSSVMTFDMPLIDDFKLMRNYQTKSKKLIEDTVQELIDIFRDEIGFHFVIKRIRKVLYALVYKATMEAKMK